VRLPAAAAFVAFVALLAATVAVGASGEPRRALTAVDQGRAEAMLLTRADLGTRWRPGTDAALDAEALDLRCSGHEPDQSDLTVTGAATSAPFERSGGAAFSYVRSYATLFASRDQASASWIRTLRPTLVRCLVHLLDLELERQGARPARVRAHATSVTRIAFPRLAARTAAYRVSGYAVTDTFRLPLHLDVMLVGTGRAQAGIVAFSFLHPLQRSAEVRLARAMAARMARADDV
jgi:hypothetical protein